MGNLQYDAIASGWLEMMEDMDLDYGENNLAVLSFGMIPNNHLKMLMDGIYNKVSQEMTKPGMTYEGIDWRDVKLCLTDKFKRNAEKEMTLAIYRNASMVV